MEPTTKKDNGALIGSIVIIIILVLGGLYIWNQKENEVVAPNISENENNAYQSSAVINAYNEVNILDQELQSESDFEVDTENVN